MLIGVVLWLIGDGIFIACSGVLDEAFCRDVILFYKALFLLALLRRRGSRPSAPITSDAGKQSFQDKCVTKLELGHEGRMDLPPPGFATFAVPQPQPLSHDFPATRFRKNRTTKNATAPVMIAATAS